MEMGLESDPTIEVAIPTEPLVEQPNEIVENEQSTEEDAAQD